MKKELPEVGDLYKYVLDQLLLGCKGVMHVLAQQRGGQTFFGGAQGGGQTYFGHFFETPQCVDHIIAARPLRLET